MPPRDHPTDRTTVKKEKTGRSNREILIPDDLWRAVTKHAALEGMVHGEVVSRSEWIRRAIRDRVSRQKVAVQKATNAWETTKTG